MAIHILFMRPDEECILAIPVCLFCRSDRIVWHYSPNGEFMVRLAYHLAKEEAPRLKYHVSESSSSNYNKLWRSLWGFTTLLKTKLFKWKVIHGILPTNQCLAKKKIAVEPWCLRSGEAELSIEHLLFHCCESKKNSCYPRFIFNQRN